ncbi:MAG: acetyl-CoA C-acyltransferase [Acidobacteria bacterium]|nr:acetyl-CoA C-acyltransferase [Acidobacteriota bacterium]
MAGSKNDVVIVDTVRSAVGRRNGALSTMPSREILVQVLNGLLARNPGVDPQSIGHVVGGNVIQIGDQSGNVIRNAWLMAGLPLEVPAVTVNNQCGSSQEAVTLCHAMIGSGLVDIAVACGVEGMSRIPMGSNAPEEPDFGQPRGGRYPEVYEPTVQFEGADRIAESWGLSRDELDAFGKRSQDLAAAAWAEGRFDGQIIPVEAPVLDDKGAVVGTKTFDRDEGLRETTLEGLAKLRTNPRESDRPSLHTAGTSSQVSDGAGAALLMTAAKADELGLTPRARLVDSVLAGSDPELMLTGPMPATRLLLERSGLSLGDIDVFEVNEAFASVVLAWRKELDVDIDKVNPNGGAIALGHPLGGTGTILITKALNELERTGGRYGLVSMCCGGGLGTGTIIERI